MIFITLSTDEVDVLKLKLENVTSLMFPEFVTQTEKENGEFIKKLSSKSIADFGGSILISWFYKHDFQKSVGF